MSDLIRVADAWEKQRRGNDAGTYIVAVAGGMKFPLLRKNREDPNGSTWTLFVTERTQRPDRPPAHDAQRGATTAAAVDESGSVWSRDRREAHVQELARRFDEREPDEVPW